MILDYATLKLCWFCLIAVLFVGFAITGGSDLGVCALLPMMGKTDNERRVVLNSIGPTWEGNQVWFITAVGAIFAAWPLVYAALFSSLYGLIFILLIPLILRPPGLDYRSKLKHTAWRKMWDFSLFFSGSLPILFFGIIIANLFLGISFYYDSDLLPHNRTLFLNLFNSYTLFLSLNTACLLLLQGTLFLQNKTTEILYHRAKKIAKIFSVIFLITFPIIWYWTVYIIPGFAIISIPASHTSITPLAKTCTQAIGLWQTHYQTTTLGYFIPLTVMLTVSLAWICSALNCAKLALFFNSTAIAATLATWGFTLFPFIVPSAILPNHSLTLWDAAASPRTLMWMLVVAIVFLPIILGYTLWAFRVMRGVITTNTMAKQPHAY
jgi:cytochrome d ubiquinol oxidase subunit II